MTYLAMILAFFATYQLPGSDLTRNDAFFSKFAEYAWAEWHIVLWVDLTFVILATLAILVMATAGYLAAEGRSRPSFLGLVATGFSSCFTAIADLQISAYLVAVTVFHPILAWLAGIAANSYSAEVGITNSLGFWGPIILMAFFGTV